MKMAPLKIAKNVELFMQTDRVLRPRGLGNLDRIKKIVIYVPHSTVSGCQFIAFFIKSELYVRQRLI